MTDSALKLRIQEDMKTAMRGREAFRLGTIRMLLAAIKQREIDDRVATGGALLNDGQIIAVIDKMIKQRLDSAEQYTKGNRQDLADKENAEIVILKEYLPQALSADEITAIIQQAISTTGATSAKDMAKVMSFIKEKAQGRADMGKVSATVKELLSKLVP
jgi:uncharacterized protein